jgi:hypothetical protein
MQTIKTIGLDIAKSVFQVHGIDAAPPYLCGRFARHAPESVLRPVGVILRTLTDWSARPTQVVRAAGSIFEQGWPS